MTNEFLKRFKKFFETSVEGRDAFCEKIDGRGLWSIFFNMGLYGGHPHIGDRSKI